MMPKRRLAAVGVELEIYVQPRQNVWLMYRQKSKGRARYTPSSKASHQDDEVVPRHI
jgi:hypothetical protein